jgi:hypothetical protein
MILQVIIIRNFYYIYVDISVPKSKPEMATFGYQGFSFSMNHLGEWRKL